MRILVGYSAGSASDIVARLIAQWLSERLGQQFVVENRPGAGGNIAAEAVVRSAPSDRSNFGQTGAPRLVLSVADGGAAPRWRRRA